MAAVGTLAACGGDGTACDGAGRARVAVLEGDDDPVPRTFCADLATTAEERRRGLAGRQGLGPDEGLLLVFPTTGEVCIENGRVTFPIDAVFVDPAGQVVGVELEIPAGDGSARCVDGVERVLEVAAGEVPLGATRVEVE